MTGLPGLLHRLRSFRVLSFRYERFGGIAQLRFPRALVFVDRDRARWLGLKSPPQGLWDQQPPPVAKTEARPARPGEGDGAPAASPLIDPLDEVLAAPLEAHLQLTNRCGAGCQGCYTGATPEGAPREWGLAEWCRAVDELAARGVFHLALGGGESAVLPWLGELLAHVRARGLVPNLTTSGLYPDEVLQRLCGWARDGLFGQINVSLDGVGEDYRAVRGIDGFAQADRAIVALRRVTRHVGINCVVTGRSFAGLGQLFAHARARRLPEVELLRFKPSGRGARDEVYERLRCTDEQHRALLPTVLGLARRHRLRVRLDCSFTPMVAHHRPDPRLVRWLAIYGCAGGDLLVAARATGALSPCSFAPPVSATVDQTGAYWREPGAFGPFRRWQAAQEPCRSCDYLRLCRGGCRVVSAHVAGDAALPDPECPRVVDHRREHPAAEVPKGAGPGRRRLPVLAPVQAPVRAKEVG